MSVEGITMTTQETAPYRSLYEVTGDIKDINTMLVPKPRCVGNANLAEYPAQCPITRRHFFMVLEHPTMGMVPTYGGPYDSYTIPEMMGEESQPWHERELFCHRYDHDVGGWVDDEIIPLRVINENVLWDLQEDSEPAQQELNKPILSDELLEEMWEADNTSDEDCKSLYFYKKVARAVEAALSKHGVQQSRLIGVVESAIQGAGGFHVRLSDGATMPNPGTQLYADGLARSSEIAAEPKDYHE